MQFFRCVIMSFVIYANQIFVGAGGQVFADTTSTASATYCRDAETNSDYQSLCMLNDSMDVTAADTSEEDKAVMISSQIATVIFIIFGASMPAICARALATPSGLLFFLGNLTYLISEIVFMSTYKTKLNTAKTNYETQSKNIKTSYNRKTATNVSETQDSYYDTSIQAVRDAKQSLQDIDDALKVRLIMMAVTVGLVGASVAAAIIEEIIIHSTLEAARAYLDNPECVGQSVPGVIAAAVTLAAWLAVMGLQAANGSDTTEKASSATTTAAAIIAAIIIAAFQPVAQALGKAYISPIPRGIISGVELVPLAVVLAYVVKAREKVASRITSYDNLITLITALKNEDRATIKRLDDLPDGKGPDLETQPQADAPAQPLELPVGLDENVKVANQTQLQNTDKKGFADIGAFASSMIKDSKDVINGMVSGDNTAAATAGGRVNTAAQQAFKIRARALDQLNNVLKKKKLPPLDFKGERDKLNATVMKAIKAEIDKQGGMQALLDSGAFNIDLGEDAKKNIEEISKKVGAETTPEKEGPAASEGMPDLSLKIDSSPGGAAADPMPDLDMAKELEKYDTGGKNELHGSDKSIWDIMTTRYKKSFYPLFMKKKVK